MTTTATNNRRLPPVPEDFVKVCQQLGMHPFRVRRDQFQLTLKQMGKRADVNYRAIHRYEQGNGVHPTNVPKLAKAMGVSGVTIQVWSHEGKAIMEKVLADRGRRLMKPVKEDFLYECIQAGLHPLLARRKNVGLSLRMLQTRTGIRESILSQYERGRDVSEENVEAYIQSLGITRQQLQSFVTVGRQILESKGA